MKWIRIKLYKAIIWLCDLSKKYEDGADDQGEINEVTSIRNEFSRKLANLTK